MAAARTGEREFVIPVERRWKLWILPAIGILYFLGVILLAVQHNEIAGVSMDLLVWIGLAVFLIIILVEFPLLRRRKPAATPPPDRMAEPGDWQATPESGSAAPAYVPGAHDDEKLATKESQQGLRVLEYSAPAKSAHKGAVYAKTYCPVTKADVLRVETLVAEGADL